MVTNVILLEFLPAWFIHRVAQLPSCLFLTAKSKRENEGNTVENSKKYPKEIVQTLGEKCESTMGNCKK